MPAAVPIIANVALNLAIGVGLSVLSSLIAPKASAADASTTTSGFSFDLQVGETVPVRSIVGLGRASGQLVYHNSFGDNNAYLQLVILCGRGEHDGLDTFLVDEKAVTLTGSNGDARGRPVTEYTVDGTPYLWVKYYTGAAGQAADAQLVAQSNPTGRWTSAHKLTGCAYLVVTLRYNADLYGSTVPTFGSIWRGLKLYDWRVTGATWGDPSTYVFSKNPVVIRLNFRRGIWVNGVRILGQGFSSFACDMAGYTAAANRCDESFYDPETDTTFPVFEFGREIGDDEAKLDVLSQIDQSYSGTSFRRGGADVPLPGQQLVSVLTLNDGDRLRGNTVTADRKGKVSDKKTMWHGQFVSAAADYSLAAYEARISDDLETLIGGRRAVTLDQPYEWLEARAQMRAEIELRRQGFAGTRVETFSPKALVCEPGDCITRVCEWGSILMVVQAVDQVRIDGRLVGVTLTLREWDNSIVPASGDSFVTVPAGAGTGAASPSRTITVSGLAASPYSRTGGGATHPYARVTWTDITDPNVDQVLIRFWPTAGTEAADHEDFFANPRLSSVKLCGPLQPNTGYTFKAIPVRSDARLCVWTNTGTMTSGDESTPAEIADGSVTLQKLSQELQNINSIVFGDGTGSIAAQLDALRAKIAAQAAANLDGMATTQEQTSALIAQAGTAAAVVAENRKAQVDDYNALAGLIEDVEAAFGDSLASGLLKIEEEAGIGGADSTIALRARASTGADVASTGILMTAKTDGAGGTISQILFQSDTIYMVDSAGNIVSAIQVDLTTGTIVAASINLGSGAVVIDSTGITVTG